MQIIRVREKILIDILHINQFIQETSIMKKQTLLVLVLLTGASLAQAGESSNTDTSAKTFINSYLGKSQPHAGQAGNEKPSVDKNLAIGAASVLGTGIRLPSSISQGTPDVAKSLALYTNQFNS